MIRHYQDISHFRAPYKNATVQGYDGFVESGSPALRGLGTDEMTLKNLAGNIAFRSQVMKQEPGTNNFVFVLSNEELAAYFNSLPCEECDKVATMALAYKPEPEAGDWVPDAARIKAALDIAKKSKGCDPNAQPGGEGGKATSTALMVAGIAGGVVLLGVVGYFLMSPKKSSYTSNRRRH
jgi:hypothetical protein